MILIVILLLHVFVFAEVTENYQIVKCVDNDKVYLLHNGLAKYITNNDKKTIEYLGFDSYNLKNITKHILSLYHDDNTSIPLIHQLDNTPDEIMRVEILKISSLQKELIYNPIQIGQGIFGFVNPSTIKINNRLLCFWGEFGEMIRVNHTDYPYYSNERYYNITNTLDTLYCSAGSRQCLFAGQDPRLILFDNKIILFYTNRLENPKYVRMGRADIILNEEKKTIEIVKNYCIHPPHHLIHLDQKNWSPFIYNNTLLLIIYVNPLTIVEMKESHSIGYLDTTVVSKSLFKEIPWSYGTLRGGTNAIYLDAYDMYLSLFHSRTNLQNGKNGRNTYFMGAYTYTSKPPFELKSVSPFPVLHHFLYEGKWDYLTKRTIDYCPFPMSLSLEDDNTLLLTLGHNDEYGYITKIKVNELLSSMMFIGDINSSDRDQ